ncbi:MAG: DUF481 domain-containing protein [Myxococcota bacterium]|nr:DUF481 domain-containing protein [Myxococcota bacterium]
MRLRPSILVALLTMLVANSAHAIVNVMSKSDQRAEVGLSGTVSGSISYQSGNVQLLRMEGGANLVYRHHEHTYILKGSYAFFGEYLNSPGSIIHKGFGHLRYRYRLEDWLQIESFGQGQFDKILRIKLRLLWGAGLRFEYNMDQLGLEAGTTYMLEREVEEDDYWDNVSFGSLVNRWSNYLMVTWEVTENVTVGTMNFFQPRFDRFCDYRIYHDLYLELSAGDAISMRVTHEVQYDSSPWPSVDPIDRRIKTTLGMSF